MRKENTSKLILSVGALALSLVLLVCAVFAWFTEYKSNITSPFPINVLSLNIKDASLNSYSVAAITRVSGSETKYDLVMPMRESAVLPIYDPESIEYAQYARALLLDFSFTAVIPCNLEITVTASEIFSHDIFENYVSNCISFYRVNSFDAATGAAIADSLVPHSFVNLSLVENTDTYDQKDKNITIGNPAVQEGEQHLYFIMTYNEDILSFLYMQGMYMLEGLDNEDFFTAYTNDIRFFIREI